MPSHAFVTSPVDKVIGVRLPKRAPSSLWDVSIADRKISNIEAHKSAAANPGQALNVLDARSGLLAPSLCHAHVHLDKCFLLGDEEYSDLEVINGDFAEAMEITGKAKQRFNEDDLLRRGSRLIEESVAAGVTAMRAFVEVDEIVGLKCVDAGLKLKALYIDVCQVQICAFAQLPLFSAHDGGEERRRLMQEALRRQGVDVVGSTPYVEDDWEKMKQNVTWTIQTAIATAKHLDFHLDYNLDANVEPLLWSVLDELTVQDWALKTAPAQRICLGHCTRLTMLTREEWRRVAAKINGNLPVAFVGLPTSDLFMMGRVDSKADVGGQRLRGTLQIPQMIKEYHLNGAISINNIGNAFTPYGSCDPLMLACFGVGVYHAGTKNDTELLFETISSRAMNAIGYQGASLDLQIGDPANLVLFPVSPRMSSPPTILSLVLRGGDSCTETRRTPIFDGCKIQRQRE